MAKKQFSTAAREVFARYGIVFAAPFWGLGNVAMGFGGDWNQTASSVLALASTANSLVFGSSAYKYGLSASMLLCTAAVGLHNGPEMLAGDPIALFSFGSFFGSGLPCLLEPWVHPCAAGRLFRFKAAGREVFGRAAARTRKLVLSVFANPRAAFGAMNSPALLVLAANAYVHGHDHMLTAIGLWLVGNTFAAFSKSGEQKARPLSEDSSSPGKTKGLLTQAQVFPPSPPRGVEGQPYVPRKRHGRNHSL